MKSVYILNDIESSFNDINEMVMGLNRAADSQNNWINAALINSSTELISVYQVMLNSAKAEAAEDDENGNGNTSPLERLATTVNASFKLSLNDKNMDLRYSKRNDIYFFLGNLIKIYYKLGKLELAKSVEKALKGTRNELPPLDDPEPVKKKYAVTYLYYSALLSLDDSNFVDTEEKLVNALNLVSYYSEPKYITKQTEKMLMILIPLRLLNNHLLPSALTWEKFPNLKYVYRDTIFKAIIAGDVKSFERYQHMFQIILLKRHLYLLFENLKNLCYLQLIKKISTIYADLNSNAANSHIVPLSAYQVGLEYASTWKLDSTGQILPLDPEKLHQHHLHEIECILANLIFQGKIKGYISHSNKCIVLSKTNAFPIQLIRL